MADIEIRMLGKFEILMDGKPALAAAARTASITLSSTSSCKRAKR